MDDFSIEYPGDLTILAGTQELNGKEVDIFDDSTKSASDVISGGQLLTHVTNFRKIDSKVTLKKRDKWLKPLYRVDENVVLVNDKAITEKEPKTIVKYADGKRFHPFLVSPIIVNNTRDLTTLIGRIVYPTYKILILDNKVNFSKSLVRYNSFTRDTRAVFLSNIFTQLGENTDKGLSYYPFTLNLSHIKDVAPVRNYLTITISDAQLIMKDFTFLINHETGEYVEKWKDGSDCIEFNVHQRAIVLSETPVQNIKPMKIVAASKDLTKSVSNSATTLHLVVDDFGCISTLSRYLQAGLPNGLTGYTRISLEEVQE